MAFRAQPKANKILAVEWERTDAIKHRERVRDTKKMVDSSPPKTFFLELNRSKKAQVMEGLLLRIASL